MIMDAVMAGIPPSVYSSFGVLQVVMAVAKLTFALPSLICGDVFTELSASATLAQMASGQPGEPSERSSTGDRLRAPGGVAMGEEGQVQRITLGEGEEGQMQITGGTTLGPAPAAAAPESLPFTLGELLVEQNVCIKKRSHCCSNC